MLRADTGQSVVWSKHSRSASEGEARLVVKEGDRIVSSQQVGSTAAALRELDALAEGTGFVLGHNLIEFEICRFLLAAAPDMKLLQLPAVDTLWLNPLAFSLGNPYHRLVKHYKDAPLTRSERSDPYLDARLALEVFADQWKALHEVPLGKAGGVALADHPQPPVGRFDLFFSALREVECPSVSEARDAIRECLERHACQSELRRATADAPEHGWVLAFAMAWISVSGENSVMPPWVRHQFPGTSRLVRRLRDDACSDTSCA